MSAQVSPGATSGFCQAQPGCTLVTLGPFEGSRAVEGRSLAVQGGPLQIPDGTPGSSAGKCITPACWHLV